MTDARLKEIAECAIAYMYMNGYLEDFLEDQYLDFTADDYSYFELEDEYEDEDDDFDEDEDIEDEDWEDLEWEDEDEEPDEDEDDEPVSEVEEKSMEEIKQYFGNCVAYWKRNGDPASIAVCKALWWDCADIWNSDKSWTPNKVKFFNGYRRYEPYGQLPEASAVKKGKA